ncbi:zinc ribbon domain-containing protein [Butyrivibrio proteoclasticus]|uniref:zinc ribbon domain-containing protein n=1 Tax=Butyrivibrio proteoclasticus TaxID=43305 RepID=UPI00047BB5E2|nr:zinc ribbon domain-containing protein [Butyrivibrio proteoclasticus]
MALITCPYCGQQISDRAENCVYCGYELHKEAKEKNVCPDCGEQLTDEMTMCPKCGCPIAKEISVIHEEPTQKDEVKSDYTSSLKKIVLGIIAVLVIIAAVYGGVAYRNRVNLENEKKEYATNYTECVYLMGDVASDCENACNMIGQVWQNSIWNEDDEDTDKYTKDSNGQFYDDFNDALGSLFEDEEFSSTMKDIVDRDDKVDGLMKKLKNPPEGYEDAYKALQTFYGSYTTMVNLATNTNGSLNSFSEDFKNVDSETINAYKAALVYVED